MKKRNIATLEDVAELAKVSVATVSRFINGKKIRPELVDRVKEAAEKLEYKPNSAARAVRGSQSGIIGMILPQLQDAYFSTLIEGATREALKHGKTIMVASSQGKKEIENQLIHQFSRSLIDGLIYTPVATGGNFVETNAFRNMPVIIAARNPSVYPGFVHMYQNTRKGGYLSTSYLLSLGHRRIAFFASFWEKICTPESILDILDSPGSGVYLSLDRFRGYLDALHEANLEYDPELMVICGYGSNTGAEATLELLSRCVDFDAVVTASDTVAGGAVRCLAQQGIEVPGDVSVIGFGNLPTSALFSPALTTVHYDMFALGQETVRGMNLLIEGSSVKNKELDVKLVLRGSTMKK
ncbi:MAG: LacI family transcriptional regulator [Spirochaetales bacterium]|nr:MAG: LacI family transcriptional regulator [Spirochaetales bacterium]